MRRLLKSSALLWLASALLFAGVRKVGPHEKYHMPCQAITSAHNGDTIEIDADGNYAGDRCVITANDLTIRGVNGRPRLSPQPNGWALNGKGLWNVDGKNTTIENIEISGVRQPSNGAAIRMEGQGLTLRNCFFHNNNDGILTNGDNIGDIVIDHCEFADNGVGDGLTHNIYINKADSFTLENSYSHDAKEGHLVKSRARVNYILNNVLDDGEGTASYEIDIPVGGTTYIVGNVIHQRASGRNPTIITYGEESKYSWGTLNPGTDLHIVNNTIINDKPGLVCIVNVSPKVTTPVVFANNILEGAEPKGYQTWSAVVSQKDVKMDNNLINPDPAKTFVDAAHDDFHLRADSPALHSGVKMDFSRASKAISLPSCQSQAPTQAQGAAAEEKPHAGALCSAVPKS